MVKTVAIPASKIYDRESFHTVFAEALGFPEFYGRNLDAFHDCLRSAALPQDGMMRESVAPGGVLRLVVKGSAGFAERCPDLYAHLVDIVDSVNEFYARRVYAGNAAPSPLVLVFEPD